jgi:hypothetical protein
LSTAPLLLKTVGPVELPPLLARPLVRDRPGARLTKWRPARDRSTV